MRILVTPSFERIAKKLHKQQKVVLDEAVQSIAANPAIGEEKIGDLAGYQGLQVHPIRSVDSVGVSYSQSRYYQVTDFGAA
ncbi:type II toxin-antitoxin system RelE/ParE family toxin [Nitrosomonas sp.]|jgi:mRNA-degrading endonuclease RelE of RelBE toxin-antitoxin system|uniref:type II toxin-antitoxin system RelE/ParE family toxin n=1 Tax=Nitrosomonas sp. TaxID=42353 RepID=UPI00344AB4E3